MAAVWKVYRLIDPRSGAAFYVGITVRLLTRLRAHSLSPRSSAYRRIQSIRAAGLRPVARVDSEHATKASALRRERQLLIELKGLLNKEPRRPFKHSCGGEVIWDGDDRPSRVDDFMAI